MLVALWIIISLFFIAIAFFSLRLFIFLVAAPFQVKNTTPIENCRTRFLVMIPAHNEQEHIHLSVTSALNQDYPKELLEVVVLADNCTDQTARLAAKHGAQVLERTVPEFAGKHHAIRWFLKQRDLADIDALVILDADTAMQPQYLSGLDVPLREGALAAQGYNGVLNPDQSMFTRLTYITNTMKNRLYYSGKAVLGLSVPLMNGMAISTKVLAQQGFEAQSVAEDFETYLRLAGEGVRVRFVPQSKIESLKAAGFDEAYQQRIRWSAGQSQVTKKLVPGLLLSAIRKRSLILFDAALDLAAPGYSTLTGLGVLLLIPALLLPEIPGSTYISIGLLICLATLILNFIVGLLVAGPTPGRIASVILAPVFIGWKGLIALRGFFGRGPVNWIRGAR